MRDEFVLVNIYSKGDIIPVLRIPSPALNVKIPELRYLRLKERTDLEIYLVEEDPRLKRDEVQEELTKEVVEEVVIEEEIELEPVSELLNPETVINEEDNEEKLISEAEAFVEQLEAVEEKLIEEVETLEELFESHEEIYKEELVFEEEVKEELPPKVETINGMTKINTKPRIKTSVTTVTSDEVLLEEKIELKVEVQIEEQLVVEEIIEEEKPEFKELLEEAMEHLDPIISIEEPTEEDLDALIEEKLENVEEEKEVVENIELTDDDLKEINEHLKMQDFPVFLREELEGMTKTQLKDILNKDREFEAGHEFYGNYHDTHQDLVRKVLSSQKQ
jgi:hypothetical protein